MDFVVKVRPIGRRLRVKEIENIASFKIEGDLLTLYTNETEHGVLVHRLKLCYYDWVEIYYNDKMVVHLDG